MTTSLSNLRGKSVAVVGGGKTGAAASRLLLRHGARVRLFDDAPLPKVIEGLKKNGVDVDVDGSGIDIVAGGLDEDGIAGCDVVVLSPGVPRAHARLQKALASGRPVINELELGVALLDPAGTGDGLRVWAITGTNGKSTTTTMAGTIAQQRDEQAFVGGNLGTPLCLAILDGLTVGTAAAPRHLVIELSSYQLESLQHVPVHAAAVTNLTPDHLDRYPAVDDYYAAKARLFDLMAEGAGVSLNAADAETKRFLLPVLAPRLRGLFVSCHFDVLAGEPGVEINGHRLIARQPGQSDLELSLTNPRIVGHHNKQNAAAAAALALLSGFTKQEIQAGLDAYGGIAHRLERVGTHDGVVWWNDSKATNVDAAVTALKSFAAIAEGAGVHLIAGGKGKGSPYAPLVDAARGKVRAVYVIGEDADAVAAAFAADAAIDVVRAGDLAAACARAAANATAGEHIVLSPACASFDQFRDYGHRGESFRALFAAHSSDPVNDAAPTQKPVKT